jgi:hypothetical protein
MNINNSTVIPCNTGSALDACECGIPELSKNKKLWKTVNIYAKTKTMNQKKAPICQLCSYSEALLIRSGVNGATAS